MQANQTTPTLTHATFLLPKGKWSPLTTPSLHLSIKWRGFGTSANYYDGKITTLHENEQHMLASNIGKYRNMNYSDMIVQIMKKYFPNAISLWFHSSGTNIEFTRKVFGDQFGWLDQIGDMGKTDHGICLALQFFDSNAQALEVHGV